MTDLYPSIDELDGKIDTSIPLFVIPGAPVNENTPFNELDCFGWAEQQPRGQSMEVVDYLVARGFVLADQRITEAEYAVIKSVLDFCAQYLPRIRGTRRFDELFTPTDGLGAGSFAVWGAPAATRYEPSQELLTALAEAGWIYDTEPGTTYFEIINGHVFAKYQSIIGSRRLVKLATE